MEFASKVISLINNKGGVFKTTLAFNIAKNFMRMKKTVVTIDFDQQENLSRMLPDITQSGVKASDLKSIEASRIIVDTGPTFQQDHIQLMLKSDLILTPFQLDRMDIEQTTTLLDTAQALNVTNKVKLILIHSGHHTQMYKTLKPFVDNICLQYGVEILCEMKRNQSVPKANLENKTVFEINSPPEVRSEFKDLFRSINDKLQANESQAVISSPQTFKGNEVDQCQA
jgi:cellulose biosynthesis protein BcsQ